MTGRAAPTMEDLQGVLEAEERRQEAHRERLAALVVSVPVPPEVRDAIAALGPADQEKVLRAHPGHRVDRALRSLHAMLEVFGRSRRDLLARLDEFHRASETTDLLARAGRPRLRELEGALNKELVAFAAAANSLVALSRRVLGAMPMPSFGARLAEAFDPEEHGFVVSLRNLLLHESFPEPNWQITRDFERGERRTDFVLGEECLSDADLKRPARAYVARRGGKVGLRDLVVRYSDRVDAFYAWLRSEVEGHRPLALTDYLDLVQSCRTSNSRASHRFLLSQFVQMKVDPYAHLARFMTPEQLGAALALPMRSREQVDFIILHVDEDGACDDELRALAYRLFGVQA